MHDAVADFHSTNLGGILPGVKTPAMDLLEGVIDYAGLYPPAKLPLAEAVAEYQSILKGEGAWLTSRFVCPAADRDAVQSAFGGEEVFLTLVGSGDFAADADALLKEGPAVATGYEARLPAGGDELLSSLARIKKLVKKVEGEVDVYAELPWSEDLIESMHEVASVEGVGFKARTGGVTADAFPSTGQLAAFITEVVALEAPFKFTAGLHEPIRYRDESLGVMRHGFINVLVASALALTHDFSTSEVQALLEITDAAEFALGDGAIQVKGHALSLPEIAELREMFGGFGSCSVAEPLDGLKRIGWV